MRMTCPYCNCNSPNWSVNSRRHVKLLTHANFVLKDVLDTTVSFQLVEVIGEACFSMPFQIVLAQN